jgi:hypothetical protein
MKRQCLLCQLPPLWLYRKTYLLKTFILYLFLILSGIGLNTLKSQTAKSGLLVKGQVVDSTSQALEGVTVSVEGKRTRTTTDK